jgi:hypothetical protein
VGRLRDICGVDAVVIWDIFEVVILQGAEKVDENLARDLEGFDQVPLLQQQNPLLDSLFFFW